MVAGFGLGVRKGWLELHSDRFYNDLGLKLNDAGQPDLFRSYSKPKQLW